ncbi:sel1 repeat family protein [Pelomyxa schiedti]|nr:sel1 repeat family protein [Pelomyxa schiedti]
MAKTTTHSHDDAKYVVDLNERVGAGDTDAMCDLADCYLNSKRRVHRDCTKGVLLLHQAADGNNTRAMVELAEIYKEGGYGLARDKPKAVSLLEKAVSVGDNTDAMVELARCYLHPRLYGLTQDTGRGVSLLQRAVGGNNTNAMVRLADGYVGAKYGLTQDIEKGMSLLLQAVDCGSSTAGRVLKLIKKVGTGDTEAMCDLSRCYLDPWGCLAEDYTSGVSLLQQAAEGNNTKAKVELASGYMYSQYGLTRDSTKGLSLLQQAIDCGSTEAMSVLASCYLGGKNVAKDVYKALQWYRAADNPDGRWLVGETYVLDHDMDKAVRVWTMAAAMGNVYCKYRLGWFYQHGVGVECDQLKAVSLFNDVTRVKPGYSWTLGVCYLRGEGVPRDWAKAVSLFKQGLGVDMDLNKASVMFGQCDEYGARLLGELGVFCQRGDCGAMDKALAVKYFRMAAVGGDPVSMFHLGVCLRDGDGIECDMDESRRWLEDAALFGYRGASKILYPPDMQQSNVVEALKQQIQSLQKSVADLTDRCHHTETILAQERISVANLNKSLKEEVDRSTSFQDIINTMTALLSATASDFRVEKLLGTGSNAAAFKVQYLTAFDHSISNSADMSTPTPSSSALATSSSKAKEEELTMKRGRYMVMKVLFNWENTPQQTMLRQKYMAECATLSLLPNHPNVIHPLGAIVTPFLPAEFVEKIPRDKPFFREMCSHKSLAILMPHCGITLSAFLSPFLSKMDSNSSNNGRMLEVAQSIFVQGCKAIQHIEAHSIVHRDIKQDNILVDPGSGEMTLIDFGEAQQCCPPNMEMMITPTASTRGVSGSLFSFSKCDSFALALTVWDALLPQSHKFIGSAMNQYMSQFNTKSLLDHFSVPMFSSLPSSTALEAVMIGMMNPDKAARVSASDALSSLM